MNALLRRGREREEVREMELGKLVGYLEKWCMYRGRETSLFRIDFGEMYFSQALPPDRFIIASILLLPADATGMCIHAIAMKLFALVRFCSRKCNP